MDILTAIVVVFVVSVVVFGLTFSLWTMLFPVQSAADRLEALTIAAEASVGQVIDITGQRNQSPLEQIAANLGRFAQSQNADAEKNEDVEKLRALLRHAGYKNRRAVDIYNGVRVAGAMLLPVAISPLGFVFSMSATLLGMVMGMAFGYYAPWIIVQNQAQNRQSELLRSFPDALDLLVSCVESGLSLDQAFRRVATELQTVAPMLAREFAMVNSEMGAGVERSSALRHLEQRTGLDEVRSLVNMLTQAERFGTSVADSLRIYSSVAREKRMARAEELAGQVGSKMTVVMIVFFLPVLMLLLIAPTGIKMMTE